MADDARRRAGGEEEEEEMEDVEDDVDEGELPAGMVADIVPEDMRGLRACMYCSLIQVRVASATQGGTMRRGQGKERRRRREKTRKKTEGGR